MIDWRYCAPQYPAEEFCSDMAYETSYVLTPQERWIYVCNLSERNTPGSSRGLPECRGITY